MYLGLGVNLRAILDEDLSHRDLVLLGSQMHGGEAVLGMAVDISLVLQQQGHHVSVALL